MGGLNSSLRRRSGRSVGWEKGWFAIESGVGTSRPGAMKRKRAGRVSRRKWFAKLGYMLAVDGVAWVNGVGLEVPSVGGRDGIRDSMASTRAL